MSDDSAPGWVVPLFALLGAATVPWTIYLSLTLHTYRLTWVGFDVLLTAALLATAYAAWRHHPLVALLAAATAALLVVDAWFDVTLSAGPERMGAIVSAALVELPLAALCGWLAKNGAGRPG